MVLEPSVTNTLNPTFTMPGHLPGLVNDSVLDMIGNTPMVDVTPEPQPEGAHPRQDGGAEPGRLGEGPHRPVDDRGRREPTARCRPGKTIIEPSSGNTGIALAMIARIGLPDQDRDAASVSIERRQMLEVFGAEIIDPRRRGLATVPSPVPRRWPTSTPNGVSLPVRQRGQPAGALRHHRPGDLRTFPRSPTSSPGSAPAAP